MSRVPFRAVVEGTAFQVYERGPLMLKIREVFVYDANNNEDCFNAVRIVDGQLQWVDIDDTEVIVHPEAIVKY